MIVCIVLFTVAINQRIRICVGDDHCSYIRGIQHSSGFEAMTTWYKYIPEELLLSFEKSGYTVCFEGFGMFPDYGDENIVGSSCFKDPNCKGILIRNDGTTKIDMNFVIAHEFGHYFDYILGDVSNSSEWISITEKESVNSQFNLYIDNTHNYYSDPDEFFAEHAFYPMVYIMI